jgi:hypothetical protein
MRGLQATGEGAVGADACPRAFFLENESQLAILPRLVLNSWSSSDPRSWDFRCGHPLYDFKSNVWASNPGGSSSRACMPGKHKALSSNPIAKPTPFLHQCSSNFRLP